jgi:hypothetical protein
MYLSGTVIHMSYINDPQHKAKIKHNCVGLTVLSISSIGGRKIISKNDTSGSYYKPIPVRVTDTQDRFYDLGSGAYQVVFDQGLNKLPKDATASLEANNISQQTGVLFMGERFFEYSMKGNLSGVIIVPQDCSVSIELGASVADLFIRFEEDTPEV